jgi:hypothetical protein
MLEFGDLLRGVAGFRPSLHRGGRRRRRAHAQGDDDEPVAVWRDLCGRG